MALDPPLAQDEEDLIVLVRSLQSKQGEVTDAEKSAATSTSTADRERANLRNLRNEFADQMRKRGINNPERLLRGRGR